MRREILHLCAGCDAELPAARAHCESCGEVMDTYAWPSGEPAYYEAGYNSERVEMLLAQGQAIASKNVRRAA